MKKPKLNSLHLTFTITLFAVAAFAEPSPNYTAARWPWSSNPTSFLFKDETLETKLSTLPTVANVVEGGGHTPFSDTYWPDDDIGIAVRYVDVNDKPTEQKTRSDIVKKAVHANLETLKTMSLAEIGALSPAEKFDIANGDYDYPLTKRIVTKLSGDSHYAYGICHGWSPTASNYAEPQPTVYVNADGITIPFGASDIKAIMAFYYAFEASEFDENFRANWVPKKDANGQQTIVKSNPEMVYFEYRQMGKRCNRKIGALCPQTVNAAALHLALANIVGRYHRSFEVQANNADDLWNYPIIGYASVITGGESTVGEHGGTSKVKVATDLYFTDETEPRHETTNGTVNASTLPAGYNRLNLSLAQTPGAVDSRHLIYTLELDADGNIIDGNWDKPGLFAPHHDGNHNEEIGFVWRASRVPFRAKYKVLNELYHPLESSTNVYQTVE